MLGQITDCKDVVVKCIKNIVECLAFYKDLVKINKENNDGRVLKTKFEQYLQNEGARIS